ncbi:MAG: hypothetical protein AAGC67_12210 [Myxococcota bacterium]
MPPNPSRSRCPKRPGALLGALLVFAQAACAPTNGPGATAEAGFQRYHEVAASDLVAPLQVDTLERVQVHSFADASLGHMIRYRDDAYTQAVVDVYVYPLVLHTEASLTTVLALEAQSILDGMEAVARREGLAYGPPDFLTLAPGGSPESGGILIERSLSEADGAGRRARSFGFVTVKDHAFFKVRITGEFAGDPAADAHVKDILEALYGAVGVRPGVIPAPDLRVVISPDITGPEPDPCALAAWILYGATQRQALIEGRFLSTWAREHEARSEALDLWRKRKASSEREGTPCAETNFSVADRLDRAGLFREYVQAAFAQPWWTPPSDLDMQAMEDWIAAQDGDHDPVRFPALRIVWDRDLP